MRVFIWLFACILFSFTAHAEWKSATAPAVCEKTEAALISLKDDNFKPTIYTEAETEGKTSTTVFLVVWSNSDNEIIVTTTRPSTGMTCIVGLGDKNTRLFGTLKNEKN